MDLRQSAAMLCLSKLVIFGVLFLSVGLSVPAQSPTATKPRDLVADGQDRPRATLKAVESGAKRHGVLGGYPSITLSGDDGGDSLAASLAGSKRPFRFVVQGPGTVSLSVWRVPGGQKSHSDHTGSMTVLENDVLLRAVETQCNPSSNRILSKADDDRVLCQRERYELEVSQKLSQFVLEFSDQEVAIRYSFDPKPRQEALDLTLEVEGESFSGSDLEENTVLTIIRSNPTQRKHQPYHALALKAGYTTNLGAVSSALVLLEYTLSLRFIHPSLSLGVETGYYAQELQRTLQGIGERATVSVWAVPVMARVGYRFQWAQHWGAYLGAKVGAHLVNADVSSPSISPSTTRAFHFAFGAFGGGDVALGPGRIVLELRYTRAQVDDSVINGNLAGFGAVLGYQFVF